MPKLEIRTMKKDLALAETQKTPAFSLKEKLAPASRPAPPKPKDSHPEPIREAPVNLPVFVPKSKEVFPKPSVPRPEKIEVAAKERVDEAKKKQAQEAETFFKEGLSLFQRRFFPEAVEQLEKVIGSEAAPFFLKRRAKNLLKEAREKAAKPATSTPKTVPPAPVKETVKPAPLPAKKAEKPSLNWPRIILASVAGLVVLGLVFLLIYYLFANNQPEQQPGTQIPAVTPGVPPEKLIAAQFEEALTLENQEGFFVDFKESLAKQLKSGFFKNVLIKKIENYEEKYLTLPETLALFDSQIPQSVLNRLSGEYNFLIYQQPASSQDSPFQGENSSDKRLVLALKIKNKEGLAAEMEKWRPTMVQDLGLLYFGKNLGKQKTEVFQENFYRGALIYYLNFPEPNLSLDYLVLDDLLLLASSRESTFALVDKILEKF